MVCHECARLFNTGAQCFRAGLSPCKSSSMADPAICVISDQILCIDPHDSGSSELVNKFGKGATIGVGRSL